MYCILLYYSVLYCAWVRRPIHNASENSTTTEASASAAAIATTASASGATANKAQKNTSMNHLQDILFAFESQIIN